MSQPSDMANPLDPLGMWRTAQGAMFDSWSTAMGDLVNTEVYAETTGRMLDAYLTLIAPMRKAMEQTMTPLLGQLNLPSRTEVASLAERMTNIEMRLDDLDARLNTIQRLLQRTADALVMASSARTESPSASSANTLPVPPAAKPSRKARQTTSPAAPRRSAPRRTSARRPAESQAS